jgi:TIR domain
VVRILALKAFFSKHELYQNAATFKAESGGLCGLLSASVPEIQAGELIVFFDDEAGHLTRQTFLKIVQDHLNESAERPVLNINESCANLAVHRAGVAKVFISYEPEDFHDVSELARVLESRQIEPWLAGVQLAPGDKKEKKTMAMEGHTIAIFALRASSLSRSLQRDLAFFKSRNCRVIPVILPRASSRFEIPESLKDYVSVDFRALGQAPYDQLVKGITVAQSRANETHTVDRPLRTLEPRDMSVKSSSGYVFLSYCRDDFAPVSRLRRALETEGHPVWWDDKIKGGEDWKASVRAAMRGAYAVIICFSSKTAARYSSGIYSELNDAIEIFADLPPHSIFLIPVLLSTCELPDVRLAPNTDLRDIQTVKLFGRGRREGLRKLMESLQAARERRDKSKIAKWEVAGSSVSL